METRRIVCLWSSRRRRKIAPGHAYSDGIREDMAIDQALHSLFGASKVAADVLVQEYGRYFQMRTVCFRGGCLPAPITPAPSCTASCPT